MKIDSIHIQHFGHFANYEVAFGNSPFALLCGQNEAGKTTLLEFLRQLLFGFPERTPYNFGEGGELGGSARLTLADRREVELKRRKGRKNTVQARVAGRDSELDDAAFRQLLGNANENVFKTVFAFGLNELREGNEGLKDESLQSALFGGGLGGALNPESLLQQLDDQAGFFFKPNAKQRSINVITGEIKRLSSEIKQKTIRSDEYDKREQAWKDAQQAANQLAVELNGLRRKKERLERLSAALPRWRRLQSLCAERAKLVVPQFFPADAEHQFEATILATQRLMSELTMLRAESAEAEKELATLQLDKSLLPLRAEIEDCHRLIQSVNDARRDLPLCRNECQQLEGEIKSELQRLRPGWTVNDLQAFSFSAAMSHAFDELCRRRSELDEERTRLETRRSASQIALHDNLADLEAVGEIEEVTALLEVLEQSSEVISDQKAVKKQEEERAKLLRTVELQRARLAPPLLSTESLDYPAIQRLPVPPRDLVARFDQELREVLQRRDVLQKSLAETEEQRDRLRQKWSALSETSGAIPSLEDLKHHRANRDELWRSLRDAYLDRDSARAPAALPDAYENAVRTTDHVADQIYVSVDEVAQREQLRRQLSDSDAMVQRRQNEAERIDQERARFTQRWCELWQPCGFEPLDPDLMLQWIDSFLAFVETCDVLAQREAELDMSRSRIAAFEKRLQEVLQTSDGDIKHLVATAKHKTKLSEESSQQRKGLERDRKRLEKQLKEFDNQLNQWSGSEVEWTAAWRKLLSSIGFPAEWNASLAREVVAELRATREKVANLSDLGRRISQMESRIAEFDPRVRRICEQLGEAFDSDRPEITAQVVQQRLATAAQIYERRMHLEERIATNQEIERKKQLELNECCAKRDHWLSRAGATNEETFLIIAARARHAAQLDDQIQQLTEQLAVARGHETEDEFNAQLEVCDGDGLQNELSDLNIAVQQQQTASDEARERAGSLRRAFDELDGRDDAVLIQEELARQQARLLTEVHRYVPLVFAKTLLQMAIKRFERENQPELIGGISKLFATMTAGRYLEIERPSADRSALYVRRSDGAELTPDQLSTGTREQLYLAIRLGYVLHYCSQTEPLPIVMDDVLVNFDSQRALSTLKALRDVSNHAQILFFTCHQHVAELVARVFPDVKPQTLPSANGQPHT